MSNKHVNVFSAIKVTYKGPTNHRGSRYVVTDGAPFSDRPARRLTVSYDYNLSMTQNEVAAAQAWLDEHIEGATVTSGLSMSDLTLFTWVR